MTKNIAIGIMGIVAICVAVIGINYLSGTKAPRSSDLAPVEGSVSRGDLDRATASLQSAISAAGGTSFDFQAQPTYGHYANFGIVKNINEVKSVGLIDEVAITFRGKTDNENAEVDPQTGQVVSFHREAVYGNAKTQAELEATVRTFLNRVYPNFAQVEPTLTFENNSKTGKPEGSNQFFTWNDLGYQKELPEDVEAERTPFIQVGITSSGYIFSYNNTIDLYRNALQEFNLTQ